MAISNIGLLTSTNEAPANRKATLQLDPSSSVTPTLCWQVSKTGTQNYTMSLSITAVENGEEKWTAAMHGWGSRNVTASSVGGGAWCRVSLANIIASCSTESTLPSSISWEWATRTYDALKITFVVKATAYPATRISKEVTIRYAPFVAAAKIGAVDGGRYRIAATLSNGWAQSGSKFVLKSCAGHSCDITTSGTEDGTDADLYFAADELAYPPDLNSSTNSISLQVQPWFGGSLDTTVSATTPDGQSAPEPDASAVRLDDGGVRVTVSPVSGITSYTVELVDGGFPGDALEGGAGTFDFPAAPAEACTFIVSGFASTEDGFLVGKSVDVEVPKADSMAMRLVPSDGSGAVYLLYDVEPPYSVGGDTVTEQLAGRKRPSIWFGEGGTSEWSLSWRIPPTDPLRSWTPTHDEQVERAENLIGRTFVMLVPDEPRRLCATKSVDVKRHGGGLSGVAMTAMEVAR